MPNLNATKWFYAVVDGDICADNYINNPLYIGARRLFRWNRKSLQHHKTCSDFPYCRGMTAAIPRVDQRHDFTPHGTQEQNSIRSPSTWRHRPLHCVSTPALKIQASPWLTAMYSGISQRCFVLKKEIMKRGLITLPFHTRVRLSHIGDIPLETKHSTTLGDRLEPRPVSPRDFFFKPVKWDAFCPVAFAFLHVPSLSCPTFAFTPALAQDTYLNVAPYFLGQCTVVRQP